MYGLAQMGRPGEDFQELVLSFAVGFRDRTQVIKLLWQEAILPI